MSLEVVDLQKLDLVTVVELVVVLRAQVPRSIARGRYEYM